MSKFLLLIAAALVVYLLIKSWRRDAGIARGAPEQTIRPPGGAEDMVRCRVCGVNLPKSESFTSRGEFYCSDEHRRIGVDKAGVDKPGADKRRS